MVGLIGQGHVQFVPNYCTPGIKVCVGDVRRFRRNPPVFTAQKTNFEYP